MAAGSTVTLVAVTHLVATYSQECASSVAPLSGVAIAGLAGLAIGVPVWVGASAGSALPGVPRAHAA